MYVNGFFRQPNVNNYLQESRNLVKLSMKDNQGKLRLNLMQLTHVCFPLKGMVMCQSVHLQYSSQVFLVACRTVHGVECVTLHTQDLQYSSQVFFVACRTVHGVEMCYTAHTGSTVQLTSIHRHLLDCAWYRMCYTVHTGSIVQFTSIPHHLLSCAC
jgi:hypothetical protein